MTGHTNDGIHFLGKRNPRNGLYACKDLNGTESEGLLVSDSEQSVLQGVNNDAFPILTAADRETPPATPVIKDEEISYTLCVSVEHCSLAYAPRVLFIFPVDHTISPSQRPPRPNLSPYINNVLPSNYCLAIILLREYTNYHRGVLYPYPYEQEVYLTVIVRGRTIIYDSYSEDNYVSKEGDDYYFQNDNFGYGGTPGNPEEPGEMRLELWFIKRTGNDFYVVLSPYGQELLSSRQLLKNHLGYLNLSPIEALVERFYNPV